MITKITLINVQYDNSLQKNRKVKGNSQLKKIDRSIVPISVQVFKKVKYNLRIYERERTDGRE